MEEGTRTPLNVLAAQALAKLDRFQQSGHAYDVQDAAFGLRKVGIALEFSGKILDDLKRRIMNAKKGLSFPNNTALVLDDLNNGLMILEAIRHALYQTDERPGGQS